MHIQKTFNLGKLINLVKICPHKIQINVKCRNARRSFIAFKQEALLFVTRRDSHHISHIFNLTVVSALETSLKILHVALSFL
jgi:hypothetical protein